MRLTKNRAAIVVASGVVLALGVSGCGTSTTNSSKTKPSPTTNAATTCDGTPKREAGISGVFNEIYDGDFTANNTNAPYENFNLMMVAFAHVNEKFELDFENVGGAGKQVEKDRLDQLLKNTAAQRKAGRLKVLISLGWGAGFGDITKIEKKRKTEIFAASVKKFVDENGLDGFDIDYETPTFSNEANMSRVSIAIRKALGNDKLFTITPNNTNNLVGETLKSCYNYVNTQSYNASGDAGFDVDQVTSLGVPGSMINAGADIENINFYDNDKNRVAYAIDQYQTKGLNGVFMWQLKPAGNHYPSPNGPTIADYAKQMWASTGHN